MSPVREACDPHRRELDAKILGWMRESTWQDDEARFDAMACELFAFQFEHCLPYARFSEARGVTPGKLSHWSEIPAVPSTAFKEARLHSFDPASTAKVFHTSGTTSARPGALYLDTLELYEASLLSSIRRFVFPDLGVGPAAEAPRMSIRILASDPAEAKDSSLSHMFGVVLRNLGESSNSGYDSHHGVLDAASLIDRMLRLGDSATSSEDRRPVALCGTSFAFVHLLEAFERSAHAGAKLNLPRGSRIMETGGFKGRSREVPRDQLYASLEQRLGIPPEHIVNQYGMTELGSQFYDSLLFESQSMDTPGPRRKLGPPWVRVRLIDPETGENAKPGAAGMIVIHDLANTGSVAALQTADLGRTVEGAPDGFEVLGRAADEEERGCSIAADELWHEAQQ